MLEDIPARLVELGLVRWVEPVNALIVNFEGVERWLASDDQSASAQILKGLASVAQSGREEREEVLLNVLLSIEAWYVVAMIGTRRWNPLQQSLQDFMSDHEEPVRVWWHHSRNCSEVEARKWIVEHINKNASKGTP